MNSGTGLIKEIISQISEEKCRDYADFSTRSFFFLDPIPIICLKIGKIRPHLIHLNKFWYRFDRRINQTSTVSPNLIPIFDTDLRLPRWIE